MLNAETANASLAGQVARAGVPTGLPDVGSPVSAPTGAVWAVLDNGAHHFQHGPIDLVIQVDAATDNAALAAAWQRFSTVLPELVTELPALRRPMADTASGASPDTLFRTPVARRMGQACWPYRHGFVTAMAAVAGSVADEVLLALLGDDAAHAHAQAVAPITEVQGEREGVVPGNRGGIRRAFVNNGGDIALYLAPGETYTVALVSNPDAFQFDASTSTISADGHFAIDASQGIGGIATSGWRGRSFSFGIADSVTVFAANAAQADVAATLIANHVNADHPAIKREPANSLKDDTDLGERRVTVEVGHLPSAVARQALLQGAQVARHWLASGLILGAVLVLHGQVEVVLQKTIKG